MSETMELVPVEKKRELSKGGSDIVELAEELVITNQEEYDFAVVVLDDARAFTKKVLEVMTPICDSTNKAHKAATTLRGDLSRPSTKAEGIVRGKISAWDLEQDRIERERIAEEKRKKDEDDRLIREEEERLLQEAVDLEDKGEPVIAEGLVDEAEELRTFREADPPATSSGGFPPVSRARGLSYRDNWKAVILTADLVPREYCSPDLVKLEKLAKENEGKAAPAGVIFKNERISTRR